MRHAPARKPWLRRVLGRIQNLAVTRRVRFTLKARRELAALDLGLDEQDACHVLASLTVEDSTGRIHSETTGEWMYLFKTSLAGAVLYLKLILRNDCLVVSFHEDEGDDHEEEGE